MLLTWPWLKAPVMMVVSPAGHANAALAGLLLASPPGQNTPLVHRVHTPAALNAHPVVQSASSSSSSSKATAVAAVSWEARARCTHQAPTPPQQQVCLRQLQCTCTPALSPQRSPRTKAMYSSLLWPQMYVVNMLCGAGPVTQTAPGHAQYLQAAATLAALENIRFVDSPHVLDWPSLRSVHPLSHVSHNSCVPLPTTRASRHVAQPLMHELRQHEHEQVSVIQGVLICNRQLRRCNDLKLVERGKSFAGVLLLGCRRIAQHRQQCASDCGSPALLGLTPAECKR
jgi:hypothetical protein